MGLICAIYYADHRLAGALAGAGVGVGALPADRQAAAVAESLVTADVHLALDVLGDLTPEVTLDLELPIHERPDVGDLLIGEILHPGGRVDARALADKARGGTADAVDVGERD